MNEKGYALANLDATVIAQAPPLAPHLDTMRARIAEALAAPIESVSVKAKSTDGLGALGRGEGIAAQAAVLLHERP
jgi:2-C-methyl-D-erythritol 2,4-cyclodiphosphate synthase